MKEVYIADYDGANQRRITVGRQLNNAPTWSPDGRFVAFASDRGEAAGKTDIYVADAAGRTVSRVTKNPGYNAYPSWSRDGRWLYFSAERAVGTRNVLRAAIDGAGGCLPAR